MQNPPRLPKLFHGNEVSTSGTACIRMWLVAPGHGREHMEFQHMEFLPLKCSEITCVLPAPITNSSSAIKNDLQTGQSAVKIELRTAILSC